MNVSLSYPNSNVNIGHIRFSINTAKYGIYILDLYSRHIGPYNSFFCSKLIHIQVCFRFRHHSFVHHTHIVCVGVSTQRPPAPPQKHHPLFLGKPPFNLQTVQSTSFQAILPIYRFFVNSHTPLKLRFFREPPPPEKNIYIDILKFFIFHPIFSFKSN